MPEEWTDSRPERLTHHALAAKAEPLGLVAKRGICLQNVAEALLTLGRLACIKKAMGQPEESAGKVSPCQAAQFGVI